MSPGTSAPSAWCSCGSVPPVARYTRPDSKRPGTPCPRAALWRAMSSSEPSSVVRMFASSSLIGFSMTTCARRGSSSGSRRRASRSGDSKLQPTTSSSPRPVSTSSARRRRRCPGVSTPTAPRRRGSVAGSWSLTPCRRATSSMRSASRVTSLRRQYGTVTSRPSGRSAISKPRRCRCIALSERVMPTPSRPTSFPSRRRMTLRARVRAPPTSTVPGTSRAPVSSSMSRVATAWPSSACSGASPFSKRALASLRSPSFSDVAWMFAASQLAASMRTRVVSSCTSERLPPMIPAIDVGPASSAIRQTSRSATRVWSSSVTTCSPSPPRRTTSRRPSMRSRSKACIGWPVSSIT